jgi:NADH dehydrogenase (ubiquinone) Fe-S protein 1
VPITLLGEFVDLTYKYNHIGTGAADLEKVLKDGKIVKTLKEAKRPAVIVGPGILKRKDRSAILQQVHQLVDKADIVREGWNGYNVLHDSASRVAAMDVGFLPSARAQADAPPAKVVYLLGSDDFSEQDIPKDAFVIYQGHHGDKGATRADVILPAAAYTEKDATYVNVEGRVQSTKAAVPMPGDAREDWKIVRALSEVLGKTLPYDTKQQLRQRLTDVAPHFAHNDKAENALWLNGEYFKAFAERVHKAKQAADNAPFKSSIDNFYQTDVISRTSRVMAKAVVQRQRMNTQFTKM